MQNIPKDPQQKILFVGYHSIHNVDLALICLSIYESIGEVPKSLTHRVFLRLNPWMRRMGSIYGTRDEARKAWESGNRACFVIPGGAEEAIQGFENAYTISWLVTC